MREFKWREEAISSMSPSFVLLTIRTGLDVPNNVIVHARPPEVPPNEFDCLVLAKMFGYLTVVFGFKDFLD